MCPDLLCCGNDPSRSTGDHTRTASAPGLLEPVLEKWAPVRRQGTQPRDLPVIVLAFADEMIELLTFAVTSYIASWALLGPPGMSAFLPLAELKRTSTAQRFGKIAVFPDLPRCLIHVT